MSGCRCIRNRVICLLPPHHLSCAGLLSLAVLFIYGLPKLVSFGRRASASVSLSPRAGSRVISVLSVRAGGEGAGILGSTLGKFLPSTQQAAIDRIRDGRARRAGWTRSAGRPFSSCLVIRGSPSEGGEVTHGGRTISPDPCRLSCRETRLQQLLSFRLSTGEHRAHPLHPLDSRWSASCYSQRKPRYCEP